MIRTYLNLYIKSTAVQLFIIPLLIIAIVINCADNKQETAKRNIAKSTGNLDSLALDSLSLLIQKYPKTDALYAERSIVYMNLGKLTKAINDLTIAHNIDSLNVDYMVQLSDMYLQFGKSHVTNEFLLKAKKVDSKNIEVLYRLGNLHFYLQDYKTAIAYLKEAREVDKFYAPVHFTYGMIQKEIGDTTKAIEHFQIAVEREPNYYDAYIVLGALHAELKDSICLSYYRNALLVLPNSYEANYGIAMFYQLNEKPEQAIKIYKEILKNSGNAFPNIYFNLGYIEMIFYAEYNTAINYFDSAIAIQPMYSAAFSNKGYCYEKLNDKINARKSYHKALEIEPNMEVAVLGLNRLDNN